MDDAQQQTQQQLAKPQTEKSVQYAGFWIRTAATVVDNILLMLIISLPLTLIYGVQAYWLSESLLLGFWDAVGWIMPVVLTILFWLRFLATPGKMLFRLQIVDAETLSGLSLKQSIIRYLSYLLSALVMFIGFLWVAFDPRKQGWHDKLAGSVVIRKSKREPEAD